MVQNIRELLNGVWLVDVEVEHIPDSGLERVARVRFEVPHDVDQLWIQPLTSAPDLGYHRWSRPELTAEGIRIRQRPAIVRMAQVLERSDQAQDHVLAELGRELREQLALAGHVRVRHGVAAEAVAEHLQEVVPQERCDRPSVSARTTERPREATHGIPAGSRAARGGSPGGPSPPSPRCYPVAES